jgi:putative ABC transport system permease protein
MGNGRAGAVRSVGFADGLIPAAAAAGHLGTASLSQILVQGGGSGAVPAGLSARFPGLQVTSRQVINAQAQRLDAQNDLLNNLILGLIAALAAAAVVNTLVMATAERRAALLLLRRVGATPRQLMSMTACQSALVSVIGIGLGIGAGATTLTAVARAFTGSWPYVPLAPALVIVGSVLALTMAATLVPTSVILAASG